MYDVDFKNFHEINFLIKVMKNNSGVFESSLPYYRQMFFIKNVTHFSVRVHKIFMKKGKD